MPNIIPDEPDHDDCDICHANVWQTGEPLWTCDGVLICEPCWCKDQQQSNDPLFTHGQWD